MSILCQALIQKETGVKDQLADWERSPNQTTECCILWRAWGGWTAPENKPGKENPTGLGATFRGKRMEKRECLDGDRVRVKGQNS